MVCRNFRHTTQHGAVEGKTQSQEVKFYNLDVIISVGYRVKSIQGTRFRQWATERLNEYIVKGFVSHEEAMDKALREYRKYQVSNGQIVPTYFLIIPKDLDSRGRSLFGVDQCVGQNRQEKRKEEWMEMRMFQYSPLKCVRKAWYSPLKCVSLRRDSLIKCVGTHEYPLMKCDDINVTRLKRND